LTRSPEGAEKVLAEPEDQPASLVQAVAGDMKRGFLLLGVGLSAVGVVAGVMGLFVVASMLASIVLVSITLYAFLRLWPDEGTRRVSRALGEADPPRPRRQAMVAAVRADGPPKARFLLALRDITRRQDSFRISQEGAERFAKTIRFLLQAARESEPPSRRRTSRRRT